MSQMMQYVINEKPDVSLSLWNRDVIKYTYNLTDTRRKDVGYYLAPPSTDMTFHDVYKVQQKLSVSIIIHGYVDQPIAIDPSLHPDAFKERRERMRMLLWRHFPPRAFYGIRKMLGHDKLPEINVVVYGTNRFSVFPTKLPKGMIYGKPNDLIHANLALLWKMNK